MKCTYQWCRHRNLETGLCALEEIEVEEVEFADDDYLEAYEEKIIEIDGVGTVYGVYGEDHSTEHQLAFFAMKRGDTVYTFMGYSKYPFSDEDKERIETMIESFKISE